jgi:hypothetical protein
MLTIFMLTCNARTYATYLLLLYPYSVPTLLLIHALRVMMMQTEVTR